VNRGQFEGFADVDEFIDVTGDEPGRSALMAGHGHGGDEHAWIGRGKIWDEACRVRELAGVVEWGQRPVLRVGGVQHGMYIHSCMEIISSHDQHGAYRVPMTIYYCGGFLLGL